MSFVVTNKLPETVTKSIQGLVSPELTARLSVLDLFLTHKMTILSRGCKPNNFESHKSPKCSYSNTQGCHLNFAECESFLLTFLLLCETNLDDTSDSGNFSVRGYL